jgi:hypothetical protein
VALVIWKYPLDLGINRFSVPEHAEIVAVGLDARDDMCAWIMHPKIEPQDADRVDLVLNVVGTGQEFDTGEHVGTIFAIPYVWHVLVMED